MHDSTIFDNSHLCVLLESSAPEGYLINDGGYPCRRYLLTPVANPTTNAERAYNAAHASARNCIERTNGIIKHYSNGSVLYMYFYVSSDIQLLNMRAVLESERSQQIETVAI